MSKDSRAKAVAVALGISYTHALRLTRDYMATLDGPMTGAEIVANVVREYRLKENLR